MSRRVRRGGRHEVERRAALMGQALYAINNPGLFPDCPRLLNAGHRISDGRFMRPDGDAEACNVLILRRWK
jgi:hypothetical protein